jgi:hypothetical protein
MHSMHSAIQCIHGMPCKYKPSLRILVNKSNSQSDSQPVNTFNAFSQSMHSWNAQQIQGG